MTTDAVQLRSGPVARATILPGKGMNCIELTLATGAGAIDVLHAEPDIRAEGSPTRSGIPVLFPFPNRIAGATFDWNRDSYELPVSHPGDVHAIHGFAVRAPWTQVSVSGSGDAVTGTFQLSRDAQNAPWPGDLVLELTHALFPDRLRIIATVTNPGDAPVPFGLGYHPYFRPPATPSEPPGGTGTGADTGTGSEETDGAAGHDALGSTVLACDAAGEWVLEDLIPTGQIVPVAGRNDLRGGRRIAEDHLDDVLTDLPPFRAESDGLMTRASMAGSAGTILLRCDEAWREVVVFTPDNRASVAVEPYTCPTDAVHLTQRGRDVGWRTLDPGGSWVGTVEIQVVPPASGNDASDS